jgi:hypothetical protein
MGTEKLGLDLLELVFSVELWERDVTEPKLAITLATMAVQSTPKVCGLADIFQRERIDWIPDSIEAALLGNLLIGVGEWLGCSPVEAHPPLRGWFVWAFPTERLCAEFRIRFCLTVGKRPTDDTVLSITRLLVARDDSPKVRSRTLAEFSAMECN